MLFLNVLREIFTCFCVESVISNFEARVMSGAAPEPSRHRNKRLFSDLPASAFRRYIAVHPDALPPDRPIRHGTAFVTSQLRDYVTDHFFNWEIDIAKTIRDIIFVVPRPPLSDLQKNALECNASSEQKKEPSATNCPAPPSVPVAKTRKTIAAVARSKRNNLSVGRRRRAASRAKRLGVVLLPLVDTRRNSDCSTAADTSGATDGQGIKIELNVSAVPLPSSKRSGSESDPVITAPFASPNATTTVSRSTGGSTRSTMGDFVSAAISPVHQPGEPPKSASPTVLSSVEPSHFSSSCMLSAERQCLDRTPLDQRGDQEKPVKVERRSSKRRRPNNCFAVREISSMPFEKQARKKTPTRDATVSVVSPTISNIVTRQQRKTRTF